MEPRKFVSARADAVVRAEGHTRAPRGLALLASPGSESGACTEEGPPGTWEVRVSPRDERGGSPMNSQAPARTRSRRRRAKPERTAVSARESKRTERGIRTSEHPILPTKRGNAPQRTPRRERSEASCWASG